MDGVLIDAKEWHYEALNKALRLFGYEINRYEHLTTFDGLPTKKKLEMLSIDKGLPNSLHSFINELKQEYTLEMVYANCKPKFIHEYALSKLKFSGYKLATASNSIRDTIEVMMEKSALRNYMDVILSASDIRNPKPDPEIYLNTMSKLGLAPDECLIVEDNENGIRAAEASGANVLVVKDVNDVNYENLTNIITRIDSKKS